ncbi:EF-hand domain protein [Raphanus sativus]|nr:EF-hand domain protein [Raphanus sativus]
MASSYTLFTDLTTGRCSGGSSAEVWKARNVNKGMELMSVDMLLIDEKSTLIQGSIGAIRQLRFRQRLTEGLWKMSGVWVSSLTFCSVEEDPFGVRQTTIDDDELDDLIDQFDTIDKKDSISLVETRQALTKDLPWKLKDARLAAIIQAIDSNTDGLVNYAEFVAFTLYISQLDQHDSDQWEQRSGTAFGNFDMARDRS